ncbi:nitric oxide-associated protein 1 [Aulostomus maculatus]
MWTLFRGSVPLRRLWRTFRSAGSLLRPEEAAGRVCGRELCSNDRTSPKSCTVDPNLEEEFVFLDVTDQEEDPRQGEICFPPLPSRPRQQQISSLKHQLQALRSFALRDAEPDGLIQFQDVDFPLDSSVVASKRKQKVTKGEHKVHGTPDVDEPISDTCCSGCGAILHCIDTTIPGYLPSEKFKVLQQEQSLGSATCQRCHLLTHHRKALNLQVPKEEFRSVVQQIHSQKGLVLLIVDLLDVPDSIVPDLPELVGSNKHVVVLGNKIDLLPRDSPNYLHRIRRQIAHYCQDAGFRDQVTDIHLISAKTGYGVEALISSLQRSWKYKGDVYLVGSANAGKSTLFNTLLESDYCKSKSSNAIQKATISPWPGTTLNLLKFPIINPTPYRMFRRQERLNKASHQMECDLSPEELKRLQDFCRRGYLVGCVGRTFQAESGSRRNMIEFDPDSLAFGENEEGKTALPAPSRSTEFTYNELKDANWLFDTPGIMKERDVLSLLTEQEVRLVVPTQAIVPRTFVLKPGMSLFLGALARIDFLQGTASCWFSVVASSRVPVHITNLEKADSVYQKHAGHELLAVPMGGSERMEEFPALVPQEFCLEGRGHLEATADIKLSSAGWVAVTAPAGDQLLLKVHGPEEAGFSLRMPPLLPLIVSLKGARVHKSTAYKPLRPVGLLDSGVSASGAKRLKMRKKKMKN